MKAERNQTEITVILSVDKSTISRVIIRNTRNRGYRPKQVHEHCLLRSHLKATPRIVTSTCRLLKKILREDWSPEQNSGRLNMTSIFS